MDKKEQNKTSGDTKPAEKEDHGFYFFPNRREGEGRIKQDGIFENLKKGFHGSDNARCIINARACAEKSPVVKLMMRAMKAHGCPVDFERHISCEPCKHGLSGGFDHTSNQVVLCERGAKNRKVACSTMAHELLHAFDKCRAHFDFKDPRHVACSEIRAANLLHCSYTSAIMSGDFGLFNSKLAHQTCVKRKALASLLLVRNLSEQEGMEIIDEVFKKCYNDFEPIGRRLRPNTRDPERALLEGLMYGYSES